MTKKTMSFEKNSILLFAITLFASACNYLFQVVVGNMLTAPEYGTLNSLLSLTNIISVPTGLLTILASKYVAQFLATDQPGRASHLLMRLEKISLLFAVASLILGVLLSGLISDALKIENIWYVIASFGAVSLGLFSPVMIGALQGAKRFVQYGLVSVISSVIRLFGSICFIWLGARIVGPLFALMVGSLMVLVYAVWQIRDVLSLPRVPGSMSGPTLFRQYLTGAFVIQIANALLCNGDILLVKAFSATAAEAGVYASGMVIGRIPLYMIGAMTAVLFPLVAEAAAKKEDSRKLLVKCLAYGVIISVGFLGFLYFLGPFVLGIMFGDKYLSAASLMVPIGLFMIPVSLLSVEIQYNLALGRTRVLALSLLAGFALIYGVISRYHTSTTQMLAVMSGVLGVVFLVNATHDFVIDPSMK